MKIILSVILFTLMQTPALARILQRKEILQKEILQKKEVRHPPVDVNEKQLRHPPVDVNEKQASSSRTQNEKRVPPTKNVDQQRAGNNNIEETEDCIPFDDPRVAAPAADPRSETCQSNICNGGCCRYHTEFLECDDNNGIPHQACICNDLTDNTPSLPDPEEDPFTNNADPIEPTFTACTDQEIDFSFFLFTDSYAEETSWELNLSNAPDVVVQGLSGDNLANDLAYDTHKCIPNDCYTLYIKDIDGLGSGQAGNKPLNYNGYRLTVDEIEIAAAFGLQAYFVDEKSFDFGSCGSFVADIVVEAPEETDCEVGIEMFCDDIVLPPVDNFDPDEWMSSQLVDCLVNVYGEGVNDIHLMQINTLSNVFEDQVWSEDLESELLEPDTTYALEFTIEIDLASRQRYTFFSTVVGQTADGMECFDSTSLEFTAGFPDLPFNENG